MASKHRDSVDPARALSRRRRATAILATIVVGSMALAACSSEKATAVSSTATALPRSDRSATRPSSPSRHAAPTPVPAKYQQLYEHLSANLDAYQAAIRAMPAAPAAAPGVAGAELLPANGNRLKALLSATTLRSVDAWLDRFRAMGIRGVTLGIKLPMLLPRFGPDAGAYTTFYATVADHARDRGLTVDVELGALFCGTAYAACTAPFDGSYEQFVADTVAQARIVIRRVRPTMLNILSEPTTEASLTRVQAFQTPAGVGRYVHDVLDGIGARRSTKVGAGGASWLAPTYDRAILKQDVDFLVMHIYPVSAHIAANIVTDTALARRAHKPIVADEVGLYKTDRPAQSGAATANTIYRLDAFSFFQPLDIRFLTITSQWAKKAGAAYLSPFWAGQFFAYLKWTPALDALSFPALTRASNQAIATAFRAGQVTRYGRTWPAAF